MSIYGFVFLNDAIQKKNVGRQCVYFVVCEGLRLKIRHGPTNVVEDRSRERPIAAHGFDRRDLIKRPMPARQSIIRLPATLGTVTYKALGRVDASTYACGPGSSGEPSAVGANTNFLI